MRHASAIRRSAACAVTIALTACLPIKVRYDIAPAIEGRFAALGDMPVRTSHVRVSTDRSDRICSRANSLTVVDADGRFALPGRRGTRYLPLIPFEPLFCANLCGESDGAPRPIGSVCGLHSNGGRAQFTCTEFAWRDTTHADCVLPSLGPPHEGAWRDASAADGGASGELRVLTIRHAAADSAPRYLLAWLDRAPGGSPRVRAIEAIPFDARRIKPHRAYLESHCSNPVVVIVGFRPDGTSTSLRGHYWVVDTPGEFKPPRPGRGVVPGC